MIYFEVQADDVERAADFYRMIFGWSIAKVDEDLPIQYWRIHFDSLAGGLLKRPGNTPPPGHGTNAFVCSFEVADFDATAARILELGGQVALPKFAVRGRGWQGYYLDGEGNVFGIYELDENAQ